MVSSPIMRCVVHLPPRILTRPEDASNSTSSSRISFFVSATPCAATSGRMPAIALTTCFALSGELRYGLICRRRYSISSCFATISSPGVYPVSVVPTRRRPFHGTAKITRPSSVFGTSRASVSEKSSSGSMMWTPLLGRMRGSAAGEASWRTTSENGPVALTKARAWTSSTRAGLVHHGRGGDLAGVILPESRNARVIHRFAAGPCK